MMASGRIAQLVLAAALFAAMPVFAQTNDPNLTPQQLDCLNQTTAAGNANCLQPGGPVPGDPTPEGPSGGSRLPGSVGLPELIVDLFPNPGDFPGVASGGQPPTPVPTPNPLRDPTGGAAPSGSGGQAGSPPPTPPAADATPPGPAITAAARAISGAFVPDEVLVTVDGGAADAQALAAAYGLEIRSQRQSTLLGTSLVRFGIPDGRPVGVVLAQLAGDGRTSEREPNHIYELQQAAAAPSFAFQRISLDEAAANGENVNVAVIDTAIDETHPALKGVIAESFDAMPGVAVTARDHATSVAGLISGTGDFKGMAPGSKIFHARAFEGGKSNMEIILNALDWAAEQNVQIVNMSFVGPKNALLEQASRGARARGMILVAAAGNNGPGAPFGYPAAYKGVIAVTATDAKDAIMQQANRGPYVYISAPGVDLMAPVGGGTDLVTGTSFAAAVVSGAIANLLHAEPKRSADSIEKALASTATDLGDKGRDTDFGFGLINTKAAEAAK
ncbi:subtilisin family serine protease [Aminobacter aminovorans]|uniref:Subtilisin DY n=1 Tax=Aminobacter aminovorans TaxID=83263 RepID=A0A380WDM2_AMIAI|nr:S8 family serine peptidase [Aminobacter aminovorans]TCS25469.1 subtilisin family serine protease [Aminobacter aminovorans]SUU87119.1 Subtilisin DY [Aminobacter aminovorans]